MVKYPIDDCDTPKGYSVDRVKKYNSIAASLSCLSNEKLGQILEKAAPQHEGIGSTSALISINEMPVFVKKIALTSLELEPEHRMSTANIFKLPLYYQYGVGSAGFGAWRELAAHVMSSNWVITGICLHFPILYHWRILPTEKNTMNISEWGDLKTYKQYWNNSDAILNRINALNESVTNLVLFLEYFPHNVQNWLDAQIAKDPDSASKALMFVDQHLKAANACMNHNGLMHFDAHFYNILTDGIGLYVSDFGLANSSKFELSIEEYQFLKQHQHYDQAYAVLNIVRSIMIGYFGEENWELRLEEYVAGKPFSFPPLVADIVKQYAPLAKTLEDFLQKLRKESKTTAYPALALEKLILF